MERKIGEIFECNGEWYQVVECSKDNYPCIGCCGCKGVGGARINGGECNGNARNDRKFVIFKKLEKVGEPYEFDGYLFQSYRTFEVPIFTENYATVRELGNNSKINIEIKQTKEDMEEKKHNLKPFDLEKARLGKPVCTRDGRKVRIICFDRITCDDYSKIVACVTTYDGKDEYVLTYGIDGYIVNSQHPQVEDLMMLPEKKEGWVNVYKGDIYKSEEEAKENGNSDYCEYIKTIKVEWEE